MEQPSCKIQELGPHVSLAETVAYRDGGTIGIVLTDTNGNRLETCLAKGPGVDSVYVGGTHPTSPNARSIGRAGEEVDLVRDRLRAALLELAPESEWEHLGFDKWPKPGKLLRQRSPDWTPMLAVEMVRTIERWRADSG